MLRSTIWCTASSHAKRIPWLLMTYKDSTCFMPSPGPPQKKLQEVFKAKTPCKRLAYLLLQVSKLPTSITTAISTLEGVLSQPLSAVGMRACIVSTSRHTDDTQAQPLPRARAQPTPRERMLAVTPQSKPTSSHQRGGEITKSPPTHTLAPSWFCFFFKGRLHIY